MGCLCMIKQKQSYVRVRLNYTARTKKQKRILPDYKIVSLDLTNGIMRSMEQLGHNSWLQWGNCEWCNACCLWNVASLLFTRNMKSMLYIYEWYNLYHRSGACLVPSGRRTSGILQTRQSGLLPREEGLLLLRLNLHFSRDTLYKPTAEINKIFYQYIRIVSTPYLLQMQDKHVLFGLSVVER